MNYFILLGLIAALAIAVIVIFNSMIRKKNQVEFAFASIDAQLKKRYDLIPNLVSACEKYMGYEQTLLKDLTETRAKYLQSTPDERVAMDSALSAQLRSVFAVAENYPNLKAVETFTLLQRSLNEVEEQLAASRRAFNAAVMDYNNAVQMFPTNIAGRLMGYQCKASFEASPGERDPVKVWR